MNRSAALWVVALGAIALFALKKNPATPTNNAGDSGLPLGYSPAQPSQLFPVIGIKDPRVDYASQPWYTGPIIPSSRSVETTMGGDQFSGSSMDQIWASFDDLFGTSAGGSLSNQNRLDGMGKVIV